MKNDIENSPLMLYKKAYNQHYKEKDIAAATDTYRKIIKSFPESDASDYASIQLSKIQESNIQEDNIEENEVESVQKTGFSPFIITFIIINLVLVIATITVFILSVLNFNTKLTGVYMLSRAMSKLYIGKEKEALLILNKSKLTTKNEITPYAISADIYLKNNSFKKAKREYETFQRLYPGSKLVISSIDKISEEENLYIKNQKMFSAMKDSLSKKESQKKIIPRKPVRAKRHLEVPRKSKIIDEEVSYF